MAASAGNFSAIIVLSYILIVVGSVIELDIPHQTKRGQRLLKLGCSLEEVSFHKSPDFENVFTVTDTGSLVLNKDVSKDVGKVFNISVIPKRNCYSNMISQVAFVIKVTNSSKLSVVYGRELQTSMLLNNHALVGAIQSLCPPSNGLTVNPNHYSIKLHGSMSEHFKAVTSDTCEIHLIRIDPFVLRSLPQLFHFILEIKYFNEKEFFDLDLYVGSVVDSEKRRLERGAESHNLVKRQTPQTSFQVLETRTGTLFRLSTQQNNPSDYRFTITSATPTNIFLIDEQGNVTLQSGNTLDYDNGPRTYTIKVDVVYKRLGTVTAHYTVTLNILDDNDENPVFLNSPEPFLTTVRRQNPPGTVVYTLNATDPDTNGSVRYYINGTDNNFSVNENTGEISSRRSFVNETEGSTQYNVTVYASDVNAPTQQTTPATVYVRVGYRAPQFLSKSYYANVREGHTTNQVFDIYDESGEKNPVNTINFQADLGSGVVYSVYRSNTEKSDTYQITQDGNLQVLKDLSYELDPKVTTLTISAMDNSSGLSSNAQLTIHLMKDFKPIFTLPVYTQTIPESLGINETVLTVSTINNSVNFNYTLSTNVFWIESKDGEGIIKINKKLDYEAADGEDYSDHSYSFTVSVDGYNISALVVIYLQNVNDEEPVFTSNNESTIQDTIGEGRTVMIVKAIDKDGDRVSYHFNGGVTVAEIFAIDSNTGRITIAPGQSASNAKDTYELIVEASDDGSCCSVSNPSQNHITRKNIRINIVDEKNFKPRFTDCTDYYNATIVEKSNAGTFVLSVSATDVNKGENGIVDYIIYSFRGDTLSNDFQITKENDTGIIRSTTGFEQYTLGSLSDILKVTVRATDHGQPPLSDECSFIVNVIDENDHPPIFLSGEKMDGCDGRRDNGYISRDAENGETALNIRAEDSDSGENAEIKYSLLQNPGEFFAINSTSGTIYSNRSLENAPTQVTLEVHAMDGGDSPRNATTKVNINIINSTFTKLWPEEYNNPDLIVNDNTRKNDPLLQINFNETIDNAKLILKCQSSDIFDPFKIKRQGRTLSIFASENFDNFRRNKIAQIRVYKGSDYYEDSYFMFILNDTNNEEPTFINRENSQKGRIEFSVQEELEAGANVGLLRAYDADRTWPFDEITYEIAAQNPSFSVDPNTGTITTRTKFDRESMQSNPIDVTVHAVDGFQSSLPAIIGPNTGSAVIQITIEDINDNPPTFKQAGYYFTVQENALIGQSIGQITADDEDAIITSRYTKYSLDSSQLFGVNENTGQILVAGILFGQANKNISISFSADDGKFSTSVPVNIFVERAYNRRPTFQGNYDIKSIVANRNYTENMSLFQVKADDPDCSGTCQLTYSILSLDAVVQRIFHINSITGNVTLMEPLQPRLYVFSVKVTDTSSKRRKKRSLQAKDAYTTVSINPANCNANQYADEDGFCHCIDRCQNQDNCLNGGTCAINCTAGSERGFFCICAPGFYDWDCGKYFTVTAGPRTSDDVNNTWWIILLICIAIVVIAVALVVAFILWRRTGREKDESIFGYDNEDYDIREDIVDYDEDGAGEDDYAGYDISVIRKPREVIETVSPTFESAVDKPVKSSSSVPGSFIRERLHEVETDRNAPPYDTLREYDYEGEGSLAGSLSSINTSSTGGEQDYDYLHEWGPKFAKLADMYNTYEDSD